MNRVSIIFVLVAFVVLSTTFLFEKSAENKREYQKFAPMAMQVDIKSNDKVEYEEEKTQESTDSEQDITNGVVKASESGIGGKEDNKSEYKSDIKTPLQSAISDYNEGNIAKAIDKVENVEKTLRKEQGEQLAKFLPEKVDGWTVNNEKVMSESDKEDNYIFGQTQVSREFVNEDKLVKLSIIIDSPLNEEIYGSVDSSNADDGTSDYKGYVTKFYRTPENNKLIIVVGKKGIVSIEGFRISHTESLKIADAFNLSEILSFANN